MNFITCRLSGTRFHTSQRVRSLPPMFIDCHPQDWIASLASQQLDVDDKRRFPLEYSFPWCNFCFCHTLSEIIEDQVLSSNGQCPTRSHPYRRLKRPPVSSSTLGIPPRLVTNEPRTASQEAHPGGRHGGISLPTNSVTLPVGEGKGAYMV